MQILHGLSFAFSADFLYTGLCLVGFLCSSAPVARAIEITYKHIKLHARVEPGTWVIFGPAVTLSQSNQYREDTSMENAKKCCCAKYYQALPPNATT